LSQLTPEERQIRIDSAPGGWKDAPNLDNILAEIENAMLTEEDKLIHLMANL
jgi:hypothetical protein